MWVEVTGVHWRRTDGAVVKWDGGPSKMQWIAFEPDPSERYLQMKQGRLIGLRRWKTAEAAMRTVDREYPLAED